VEIQESRGVAMKPTIRLVALFCLAAIPSFAGSWSGYLVDSKCYDASEQNVNPWETLTNVTRDKDLEIRLCSPNAKTKSFAVVQPDWQSLKLDSTGNAKAVELVRTIGKKSIFLVTVTGEKNKSTVTVDSISIAK
jgi:hypothetical protein